MSIFVPGTTETDPKKQNMSLQQIGAATEALQAAIAALQSATYVNSFKARTGTVIPVQGDYPASLIPGTTTNDNAAAGNIGEYVESVIVSGSAVALVSGAAKTVTSITLSAGDWDVSSVGYIQPAASTSITSFAISISGVTNTLDTTPGKFSSVAMNATVSGGIVFSGDVPAYRLSLAGSTTVYLVATASFTVSTASASGLIRARRVR